MGVSRASLENKWCPEWNTGGCARLKQLRSCNNLGALSFQELRGIQKYLPLRYGLPVLAQGAFEIWQAWAPNSQEERRERAVPEYSTSNPALRSHREKWH